MSMFKKKPKPQYRLDIKTYSVDAPKMVKKRANKSFKKILASSLITLFIATGLGAATVVPASADNFGDCIMDGNDNEWVGKSGGMWTSALQPAKDGKKTTYSTDAENYPTMRDRYGDKITFLTWIPAMRDEGSNTGEVDLYQGVKTDASWATADGKDNEWNLGSSTIKSERGESIRLGEGTDRGAFSWGCIIDLIPKTNADLFANMIFQVAKGVSNVTTFLYVSASTGSNITDVIGLNKDNVATSPDQALTHETRSDPTWAYQFGQEVEKVLTGKNADGSTTGTPGLYQSLYLDFLLPIILIGALVVLLNAIRARAIRALSGIIWMVVAVIAGMLLLQRPMMIPQIVDGLVGTITSQVNKAIIGSPNTNPACDIPDNVTSAKYSNTVNREAKEMECYIWYYTIYVPWAEGQFGTSNYDLALASGKNGVLFYDTYGVLSSTDITIGYSKPFSAGEYLGWPVYLLEYMELPQGANVALTQNQAILNNIGTTTGGVSKAFGGGDRVGAATLALAVSLAAGIFVSVNSVLIIGYQIAMLLLLMVAPVFLLIGIIPSQLGKGIGLRWGEMVVGLAVKRMIIALMMALFIKMFIIVAGIDNIGVGFQVIIFSVLAYIGLTKRNDIMEMFTGAINFGGNKNIGTSGVENVGKNAGKIALGGLIAGAGVATKLGRKGVQAAAPAVKRNAVASATNRKIKRISNISDPEKQQQAIAKVQNRASKRREAEAAIGGVSRSDAGLSAAAGNKVRSTRASADQMLANKINKGDIKFTPKVKQTAAEKATEAIAGTKHTWNQVKATPRKVANSTVNAKDEVKKSVKRKVNGAKDFINVVKNHKNIEAKKPPKRPSQSQK